MLLHLLLARVFPSGCEKREASPLEAAYIQSERSGHQDRLGRGVTYIQGDWEK